VNNPTACCVAPGSYCVRTDRLVGLSGVHVTDVTRTRDRLVVTIETPPRTEGCRACGVVALSHGRRTRVLHDIPCAGVGVRLRWRQRTWACPDAGCPAGTFTETLPSLVAARGRLTVRAIWWAIRQLRTEHATIAGLARQLGTDWHTVWRSVRPRLVDLAADESRFAGVSTLGVDEHVWHHTPHKAATKGPGMLTGMVDLSRDQHGRTRARLLDLVPGRTGKAYTDWLTARGEEFRAGVQVATLDPFRGYANAIDDQLTEAAPVLDAFHVVKLGADVTDQVRRRVQQETLGHRGHAGDPLYRVRNILRRGAEHLTDRQWDRLTTLLPAGDPNDEVLVAWQCYQQLRGVYQAKDLTAGRRLAEQVLESFHTCPIKEVARLGRTLRRWRGQFLGYFTTDRASNGGTEAINGIIELHRRIARGYRNRHNYRLRMLLVAGGLLLPPELR
jgi:transposase